MIIIGIDPDSKAHGVAFYFDGELKALRNMSLLQLFDFISKWKLTETIEIHMEDTCAINATFGKEFVKNARAQSTISRSIGMCQQAQIELERLAEYFGIKVFKYPISKQWKDAKTGNAILKQLGYDVRSNEDTRSAAYFGYCGVKQWHTRNKK